VSSALRGAQKAKGEVGGTDLALAGSFYSSAGRQGGASSGLSTVADSRPALAAPRGIIVPSSAPGDGLGSSRSRRPSAGSMAASHASFGSPAPVGEAILRPAIRPDLLRLAAGEAIRTSDTSDALCRTTLPKRRGSAPLLPGTVSCRFHCRRSLRGRHSTDPRPRRTRLVSSVAGLGRRSRTNQSAFRRFVPDLSTRAGWSRLLITRAASPRTLWPVARLGRPSGSPSGLVKGRWLSPSYLSPRSRSPELSPWVALG
jgi:hypothetical protein